MNPEPLTKEKIKKWKLPERWYAFEDVSITNWRISNEEKCYFRYKEVHSLLKQIKLNVKSAVEWLLKEIENMKKELSPTIPATYEDGFCRCLIVVEDLIKKAFSGVIEK